MATKRTLLFTATILVSIAVVGSAQKRIGPKNRENILDARVDPAFSSATTNRLIMLPFGNELDYPEGGMILTENFIGAMHQKHPEVVIVPPTETKQLIQDHNLTMDYRAFLGNYATTGVATKGFLEALGRVGNADGILIGRILGFGVVRDTVTFGGISWGKNKAMVGMELSLLRTKDARELWWGTHGVQGEKGENVRDLAKVVGDVFGTYFGRPPY